MSMEETQTEYADTGDAKEFSLGVLFIHGIGGQPRGDTLRRIADPIVQALDHWIFGVARLRGKSIGQAKAEGWANAMPSFVGKVELSTSLREQAFEMAWSAEPRQVQLTAEHTLALKSASLWSGGATLRDGQLSSSPLANEIPAHAVLDIHTMDEQYNVKRGTALVAESWWAQSFVPPSASALLAWAFKVLPLALGMHFGDGVRRYASRASRDDRKLVDRVKHSTRFAGFCAAASGGSYGASNPAIACGDPHCWAGALCLSSGRHAQTADGHHWHCGRQLSSGG
jgi:hypothetical protein